MTEMFNPLRIVSEQTLCLLPCGRGLLTVENLREVTAQEFLELFTAFIIFLKHYEINIAASSTVPGARCFRRRCSYAACAPEPTASMEVYRSLVNLRNICCTQSGSAHGLV